MMVRVKKSRNAAFGRKIDQVLDGAWRIFQRDGYAGAGVDDIARAAGVSKATLYAYFPDKRLMFQQTMQMALERNRTTPLESVPPDLPAASGLPRITAEITGWLNSDHEIRLFRLAIGEANRFPAIARGYHDRFETLLGQPLRDRLEIFVKRGDLEIEDTALAARQLIRLCGLAVLDRAAARAADTDEAAVLRSAEMAATMFLRAYCPAAHAADRRSGAREADVAPMR
ncbi:TetR/AcrR family transcriptional regulator [Paracoccus methylarcula]|uniref:TetR/AcrR family transcriptional regulator n=1 Tax=Paracoccus methylarcula TaxID=72022 RepID=A0A422QUD5_9RHOB|nr:TetR/AcrR family transcriptional regulator [Paracoccus methylarcula]RNF33609.1 TetR/AcrR family transcriptional regulator [Paracoccus methylarcula]